ncbi:MAG: response regulator [bacterium]
MMSIAVKPLILSVDDDEINHEIMRELLEDEFDVDIALNGQECLELVQKEKPRLILLDVNMPVLNGYETCRILRDNADTKDIPILMVSALASQQEKLEGYEAGADDYISKPFNEDELLFKIHKRLDDYQEKNQLQERGKNASKAALSAMMQASDLGVVLECSRELYRCNSAKKMTKPLLKALNSFDLEGVVLVSVDDEAYSVSSSGEPTVMDLKFLDELKEQGRIYDFGQRMAVNYAHISLLIKNMPVEEDDRYGRLKDSLALLVEIVDAKAHTLEIENAEYEQSKTMARFIKESSESLQAFDRHLRFHRDKMLEAMAFSWKKVELDLIEADIKPEVRHKIQIEVTSLAELIESETEQSIILDNQLTDAMQKIEIKEE